MIKKNIIFTMLLASIVSIPVQAHWAGRLSKNEKAAFCNLCSYIESMLTSFQLGSRAEEISFRDKAVKARVSRQFRNNFQKKCKRVAHMKKLSSKIKEIHRLCIKNSSSHQGRENCKKLREHCLYGKKEELLKTLAIAQRKKAAGLNYKIKNKVSFKAYR